MRCFLKLFGVDAKEETFDTEETALREIKLLFPDAVVHQKIIIHLHTKQKVRLFWSSQEKFLEAKHKSEEERLKLTSTLYRAPPFDDSFSEELRAEADRVFLAAMKTFGLISDWRDRQNELDSAAGMIVYY